MKIAGLFIFVALLMFASPSRAQCVPGNESAAQCQDSIAKVKSLMGANGFDYQSTNSNEVWKIYFSGQHMSRIKVILAIGEDSDTGLVVFVTVAEKDRLPATADFRGKLLSMNHRFDSVKVNFDGDGDLGVRIDAPLRILDAQYLKYVVQQVENVADDVYGQISSSLAPLQQPDSNNK